MKFSKTIIITHVLLGLLLSVGLATIIPFPVAIITLNETAGGGQNFYQDFSETNDWTKVVGTAWQWQSSTEDVDTTDTMQYVYDNELDTLSGFASVQHVAGAGTFAGLAFRADGTSANAYALRYESTGTQFKLRSIQGSTGVDDIFIWDITLADADYFGVSWSGEGVGTTAFILYDFGASDPGSDFSTWESSADEFTNVTSATPWISLTEPADTGKQVGVYNGNNTTWTFDDWRAGDQ